MRKNDRFEQELNVTGAARRAKAFGIKAMTVVVTAAMLVSGVPTRVIAEGLQEAGVIATQDSTDQSASSSRQLTRRGGVQDQSQATDQSNTQEQPQAASEQAAQPSSQDNAAAAQNDSPSAQPAQPSQQTATADIALTLNNASITYKGQVVAQPAQKVTAPTSDNFQFTVQPDNGYKLSKVTLTVSGTDRELKADANSLYTVDAADVAQSPRVTLQTEQEKAAEPAKEATPIEDAEGVDGESNDVATVADEGNVSVASDASGEPGEAIKAKVGDTVTLKGTSNKGYCDYSHGWEVAPENKNDVIITPKGSNATVSFKSAGNYTIEHKYCKKRHWIFGDHETENESFEVEVSDNVVTSLIISGKSSVRQFETIQFTTNASNVTWSSSDEKVATVDQQGNVKGIAQGTATITAQTPGTNGQPLRATKEITVTAASGTNVQVAYFYFVKPGSLPSSNDAVDWYPAGGVEALANKGSINITDMETDGSKYGNSRDNVANRVVSWPNGWGEPSADGLVLGRNNQYWNTLFEAYKSKFGITNVDDVKAIILQPYKISKPSDLQRGYHLDCTVEIVAKSTVTAEFKVWYPGDTGYTMIDTQTYPLDGDSVSVLETTRTLEETSRYKGVTYKLYSWYDNPNISGNPVNFPATVSSNVKYYAKYVAQDQTVTVEYKDKATGKQLDSKTLTGLVKGQTVIERPKSIKGYEVDEDSKNPKKAIVGTDSVIEFYYNAKKGAAGYYLSVPGATWSGGTPSDLVSWDKDLRYKYNYGFAKDDTFDVTPAVPVANDKVFIGWLDKARGNQASTIRRAGDKVTYIHSDDSGYCLDALWASLSATGENVPYDGKAHGVTVDTAINDGSDLRDEYKQQAKNHVTLSKIEYSVDGGKNWTDTAPTFVNAGKYPVFVRANVTIDGNENKQLTAETEVAISKREVTLKSADLSKPYDGTPLINGMTALETETGFVEGEGATYNFTGSQTVVGSSKNTFSYTLNDNTIADNYNITKTEGTLTINNRDAKYQIKVKANSTTATYDGKQHSAAGVESNEFMIDGNKYLVSGLTTEDPADVDAGTYTNNVTGTPVVTDAKGNDVTSQFSIGTENGSLVINKRAVTLKSASITKVYDGTPLTNGDASLETETGFVEGESAIYTFTGSQDGVGSSANSFTVAAGKSTNLNNYDIKKVDGTLTVTAQSIVPDPENPDGYKGVTISSPFNSPYDGNEHKWVPEVKDDKGNALVEGEDYTVSYDTDNFVDVKKITVTIAGKGNYGGSVTKTYKITKAPLKVSAKSASKVYDGNALTAGGTIEGLVGDEKATVKTKGSQTEVGSSNNEVDEIVWDTAKEGNYYIQSQNDGVLTVAAKGVTALEVGKLSDVVYSGVDQAQKPEVKDGGKALKEGADYKVSFSKDVKNVGTVTVAVTGKGNYAGSVERTYQITPATLTVTTPSDSRVYNGKALTAEGTISGFVNGETAAFATTGSQTKVGSSANTYAIDWGAKESAAKKSNYTVEENLGTLTVTEFAGEVVATAGNYSGRYDGKAHGVDVTVTDLPEGYTVKSAVSNATATDVTKDKVTTQVDDLVIVNADGEDVTSELKITKNPGTINIMPATLTVITYGAKAEYNGQALTAGGKVTGFVNNEAASFTTTGSQTEVGKSENTYKIDWNDTAKESNYTVNEKLGTLEVTKNMTAVMVIPNGGSKVYDGKALESDGVTTYGLPSGYTLEAKTKGSVTNVGSATAEVESYTIKNAAGKDVTDQFGNVTTGKATLGVTKRPVTVTSATDTKVYDGNALTKPLASVTAGSLAEGESFTYEFTGEQTVVGSTANSFTVKAGENTSLDNYKISKVDGTLTVAAKSIVPDPSDEHNKMSVDAPASVKYDGNAHKWIPTVKDGDKTLKEGADYTVSYSKDDFTNVTGVITVTITGKGNYAGTVTRTYEITKRSVKLTGVKNVTKVYDGTALEAKDVTVTGDGFVKDEVTDIKATGSVTEVTAKPVENPIEFTAGKGFKEGNYTIEKDPGTLQVTARSIDDTTYGMSVSKPKSVEYDGQAHKWSPTVMDGEKKLVEGTDYTVSYGKDDFTNVTGEIKATITGKGNYAGAVERVYQITPAPLTVETEGATKVYDGEALTHDVATIKGLKNEETATIHATGSQTEVGESSNGYAISWDGSAQKGNYTIKTETIGKLVVSETADQITATPVNVETTYDGKAHGTTVQVTGLPKGYTVEKAESKATATDVADGEVKAKVDELVIVNAQGKDVTSKLNIKRGTATIKINPAPLTVTTNGGEKEYDGTALTAGGIKVEGLKGKDSISTKTTGSRTKVGSSDNTYEINWKDTKKSNYEVTDVLGTLRVTPSTKAVTLTSGSASRAYNGHALTSDKIEAEGLPEGFTVKAKMDGVQTDAGSSKNTVKSYKILDAKGDDVTDMFANVTVKTGTLEVSRKEITVETEGATKVYDGQELTNKNGAIHGLVSGEHADVVTNGTQTNVGSSDNGYTIAWGTAKEGNYTIASDTLGKLIVTPQSVNPNDPSYRKLQVNTPADLTYDGQTHKWAPEVKDYTGTELKEGVDYTLAYDTDDFINAGAITVTVVGKGNYTGTASRTYRIKPAPVSIKTESAARVYNGKALTAGGAITGLVNGETVDFRVTGSQTKVGHSVNTYKLAWTGTAREANYTVDSVETGTLTVTESEDTVVVTTTGGTFTYDGKAHGATVAVSQLPEGYTVDGTPSSDTTATDVNGDGVKATVDHLVIRNAQGEDVTSKLNIKKVDGTIKVLPAELTVTTDSATKVYDGKALTAGATVNGLVDNEEVTLKATGEQTQVGSSSNGYKLTFDKTAKAKNYKVVSENLGTLTVTKQSIVPSDPGTPSDNYKGVTVDDPKDAVYDGVEHKWMPVVKDADGKTLVEGVDYVVAYDTDDFIDITTINVTITGKGNYTGAIAKSYRITKAPLHVVTGSATKVYDGKALTSATVTIDGLAKRDRIGITVTGKQTTVGSSQNTYAIDWMQTSADNYELTEELGTLTVTPAPAKPKTPTRPTTPATPTVPTPTPNNSDGGSISTTTAPKGDDSSASNDQEQKEEKIIDAKNPLGKFDGKKDTCWVHGYMIICAVATAAYGLFVGLRRDKHSRRLQNDLDKVLGNDDKTQE